MSDLLSLSEAQGRLIALARPRPPVQLPAGDALGHFLASDLTALRTQPEQALSAMDGWAVRGADLPGPWEVVGESSAGHPFKGRVRQGEAIRISTGAVVPDGADAVLVQEQCRRSGASLDFAGDPPSPLDRHIRKPGLDFQAGDLVLPQGMAVTPGTIALAIAAGHALLPVVPPPRIAIVDTGDELVHAGAMLRPGQIPASNGPMLHALLGSTPCLVAMAGPVRDDPAAIADALADLADFDLVITTGGASVGDHDHLRPALHTIGADVDFWRVAIKPGKPIMVATRGAQVIVGLPGNPASAFVTAHLFALPFVRALMGAGDPLPPRLRVPCQSTLAATGKRAEFIRARLERGGVSVLPVQDSGAVRTLAHADVLICRPPQADAMPLGELAEVILL